VASRLHGYTAAVADRCPISAAPLTPCIKTIPKAHRDVCKPQHSRAHGPPSRPENYLEFGGTARVGCGLSSRSQRRVKTHRCCTQYRYHRGVVLYLPDYQPSYHYLLRDIGDAGRCGLIDCAVRGAGPYDVRSMMFANMADRIYRLNYIEMREG
jgi:hypothetical protein